MNKAYIGIDPGLDGGIALVCSDDWEVRIAPTIAYAAGRGQTHRALDPAGMRKIVDDWMLDHPIALAAIERAQSSPRMGVSSAFNYGVGFGMWLGVLAALKVRVVRPRPQEWMAVMLAGEGSRDKRLSVLVANRLFPEANLTRSNDGPAEALLIAEWARRTEQ